MDIRLLSHFLLLFFCLSSSLSANPSDDLSNAVYEETVYDPIEEEVEGNASFTFPTPENIYVNDYANLLDNDSAKKLINQLTRLKSEHDIEMTVITIPYLSDYNAGPRIEPFATALFNEWGVGNAQRNDGVMILVSRNDREMRIEIGSGYGSEWDSKMKRIIDNKFIPHFKNGNYQKGIEKGVAQTIKTISGSNYSTFSFKDTVSELWNKLGNWWFAIILPIGLRVTIEIRNLIRRRPRDCHRCSYPMALLDDNVDDLHLEKGQILEEFLSSVDYYVRHCAQCEHIEIDRYKSWFTSLGACPKCEYVTLESDSTTINRATTSSTGLRRVDYNCQNCGYHDHEMVTIPKVTESSSSSSSGSSGGSFGGGSSSGGGASGSW